MSASPVFDVVSHRPFGWVRYACVTTHPSESQADYVARLGLELEGGTLRECDRSTAEVILVEVFSRGLSHDTPILSPSRARDLAVSCFERLFPSDPRYFTNVSEGAERNLEGLMCVSAGHTFTVGVVAVGAALAACVWVDEDD